MARRRRTRTLLTWLDAWMAAAAHGFIGGWGKLERLYKRPLSRFAAKVGFWFYPLLALCAIGWLAQDWLGKRSLDAAEDAVFDMVVRNRPVEPPVSRRVVIIEIDDCSIEWFARRGEGGWPWSRQRHADLLDALDRGGIRAVGYDVMFADASPQDPMGDEILEAMAAGGEGRFVFGASRVHSDFDASAGATPASRAPGAFPLVPNAEQPGPRVALLLPYGAAMREHAALLDITRSVDGVLRDMPLHVRAGDWAIPSLPLRLAAYDRQRPASSFPASVRIDWRTHARLPYVSAADLIEGKRICRDAKEPLPPLRDALAIVGYTASGLNDTKPTPVNLEMPGVEIQAEATAALVDDSGIWMPPAWLKYILAASLLLLTAFAFFRGEPTWDIDAIFVATNLLLLALAWAGLTFFGVFFDIFASIGFVSLSFGLCRTYAAVQRGRAVGNSDFVEAYDPSRDRWLILARLRFVPYPSLDARAAARRRREYRRRLRRFLYAGTDAAMLEAVVEWKTWLHEPLDDLMVLIWKGPDRDTAARTAQAELDALYVHLNAQDDRLDDDGIVKVCAVAAAIDDDADGSDRGERLRLREALGNVLDTQREWPLSRENPLLQEVSSVGAPACVVPPIASS